MVHPLLTPTETAPDPFVDLDPKSVELPDKQSPLEDAFHKTGDLQPDESAAVVNLSEKLGQSPEFVAGNMDSAKKAAAMPSSEYFATITKQYPLTAEYLSDPKKMAVAKDDIDSLSRHEGIAGLAKTLLEPLTVPFNATKDAAGKVIETLSPLKYAYQSGMLQEERDLLHASKVFGGNNDAASMTGYLMNRLMGKGAGMSTDERLAVLNRQLTDLEANRPHVDSVTGALKRGIYGATEFLPWIKGSLEKGAEYAIPLGLMGLAAGSETGPGAVVPGVLGAGTGFTLGGAEYNFLRMTGAARSQFSQIRDQDGNPLPDNVVNIASVAAGAGSSALGLVKIGAVLRTIPGGSEFLQRFESSVGNQVLKPASYKAALVDFAKKWATSTGEASAAMTGITAINIAAAQGAKAASGQQFAPTHPSDILKELATSGGDAALTFGIMGLPGSTVGLTGDLYSVRRSEMAKRVYEAMGKTAEAAKLRERLPEAYQEYVAQVTKGSPVENVYIPADRFEQYFQDKNIQPATVASELGVTDSLAAAREVGGDVQIPMSVWASKVVGTEHWQGLADDVKFFQEDLTPRQATERKEFVAQMVQTEADNALKEDPKLQQGKDLVFNDIREKLVQAGRPKPEAEAAATVWSNRAVVEARRRGISPEEWYAGDRRPRVVTSEASAEPVQTEAPSQAAAQSNLFDENGNPHPDAITGEPDKPVEKPVEKPAAAAPAETATKPEKPAETKKPEAPAKEITDVGQELWYNRRNLTGKGLNWEDIRDTNAALKVKEVIKAKVWPRPDYEQLVTDGMSPFTAHVVKQVYDSIAAKPDVSGVPTDVQMEKYIAEVKRVKEEVYAWAKEVDKFKHNNPDMKELPYSDRAGTITGIRAINDRVGRLIDRIYPVGEDKSYNRFNSNQTYLDSARLLGSNKFIRSLQVSYDTERGAQKALETGWPKPQEAWQRRFDIKEMKPGQALYRNGKRETITKPEFYLVAKGQRTITALGMTTMEEAIAKAKELSEVKKKVGQSETPLDIANLKREGPPLRPAGLDVQPKDLMDKFGFRGVNYGNWTSQGERQIFTNHGYDAMLDLADVMHLPPKAVSLDGLLGLAFGAQGRGGSAAAHFIPGVNEINLTKTAGAGSLAHEWAHALDHYFAVQAGETLAKSREPFLSTHVEARDLGGIRPEIAKAFRTIVDTMTKRDETPAEIKKRVEERTAQASKRLDSWIKRFREMVQTDAKAETKTDTLKEFDGLADRIRKGDLGTGYEKVGTGRFSAVTQTVGEIRRLIKDATGRVPNPDELKSLDANASYFKRLIDSKEPEKPHTIDTSYMKAAKDLDKEKGGRDYWTQPTEMFARAFQSYVLDKLDDEARRNDFLTRPQGKTEAGYPHDKEREAINQAFDTLVKSIKTKETDRGVALYQDQAPEKLPIVLREEKSGDPYAVFVYNWRLSKDQEAIPYFRLYGDPQKINEMTALPNNPTGNGWRSDVSLDTIKDAGIPIVGKAASAKEEPIATDRPLFQDPTDPRGFIRFTPKETIIGLVKADASTFMHESAHFWLKDMHDYIKSGQADEKYMADWKTLSDWLKVEDGQKELTRDQQEKFAKGFEAYLREGKSPSESLKRPFTLFRRWLTRLYKDPEVLGGPISDDVRGVMDRMLASDDEIAFAESRAGLDLAKDIADLDPEVRAKVQELADQAHETAVSELLNKQMEELSKEHQERLQKEAISARIDAEKAVGESPIQTAMEAIKNTFNKDALKTAQDYWMKKLDDAKRQQFDQLAETRGFSCGDELAKKIIDEPPVEKQVADQVAAHMAQFADLRNTDKIRDEAMKAIHNEKMAELLAFERAVFQSMIDQATVQAQAKNALGIEKRFSSAEEKVKQREAATPWRNLAQQARLEAATAKLKAKEIIGGKSVKEAGAYLPYFTAERNAAIGAAKALMQKDYAKAADFKRIQMLNHALATESHRAYDEIQKTLRYFDRFASRGQDLKDIPYGFMRQIDVLLADRGLAEPRPEDAKTYLAIAQNMAADGEDPAEIAHKTGWMADADGKWKPEALSDTIARIQSDYRSITVSPDLLNAPAADYRQMSMGQFRDLKSAVKSLNDVGRGYDRFLDETIKMDRKEAAAKFRQFVETNIGQKYREARDIGTKPGENAATKAIDAISKLPDSIAPSLVNLFSFCDFLDGFDKNGLAKDLIYRPLKHAEDAKLRMSDQAVKDMRDIVQSHFQKDEYEKLRETKVFIASRDREMTLDQIQAFANNYGTEIGRDRLRKGYGTMGVDENGQPAPSPMTREQEQEILSHVSKNMWDFAQAQWDYNDKYWPEIVALQQKVAGETPERVEPATVQTPYGDYRGGYYHLAYDRARSNEAFQNIDARNALYKVGGAAQAHTSHGFTSSRVQNYNQPVNLDSRVEFTHLEDLIHDLNFRKAVIDVSAFLRQKDTREAVINAIGREGFNTIQNHLKWVAADQGEYMNGMSDKIIQRLRFGATMASLGLRPITGPIFLVSNAISAVKDLGPVGFGNSIKDFLADRDANVQMVDDLSARMTHRSTLRDRDLADMDRSLRGNDRLLAHFAFYPHQKADQAITYPLWLHVYKNSVGEFGQQKAIDLADEAVTKLAGSGSILDQAMIQRGSEMQKIFTWWYSWAGTQFNRFWRDGKAAGLEYDKGNVGTALSVLGTSAFYGWFLQGMNENFWRELARNSPNADEDKRNKRMALRLAMQGISYVPVLRELAQYGMEKSLGSSADLKLPFQQSFETLTDPIFNWAKEQYTGKESPHFWEDTAKTAAIVGKYPQYLNTVAFNFIDYLNGQGDLSWRDLFTRRTKN